MIKWLLKLLGISSESIDFTKVYNGGGWMTLNGRIK
jgi:hypothetical protein